MKAFNTPIYDAVCRYTQNNPVPFHMPGHKLGKGLPDVFLKNIAELDVTEIPGTDNLHHPVGAIREAQELAARAFGADRSYFLVNGSTAGIHAIISSMCSKGQKLIVTRDCHRSVFGGLMIAGAEPVFVMPEFIPEFGIMGCVTPEAIDKALGNNPEAVGVMLTRPNYYGICCNLTEIAKVVHSHGKILAVDEAHGSHLKFSTELPLCAMESGADICVQSAHKTLPAFTQGAYLHVRSKNIDIEKLEFYLDILQTTSPSYVIMAFLDIARSIMEQDGSRLLNSVIKCIRNLKNRLEGVKGLKFLESSLINGGNLDETRIVANLKEAGITGYEAQKLLRRDYCIEVEMADLNNVVAIATVADNEQSLGRLFDGFEGLCKKYGSKLSGAAENGMPDQLPTRMSGPVFRLPSAGMSLSEVMGTRPESVDLKHASGRICRCIIAPYPPGIPMVFPGEEITDNVVQYLLDTLENGGAVTGVDGDMRLQVCSNG